MTSFEHAMVGSLLALGTGLTRSQGWGLALMAAPAAALADWDGLSILFGGDAYSRIHRVWGHNFFATAFLGVLVGALGYLITLSTLVRQQAPRLIPEIKPTATPSYASKNLACWIIVGMLASISHLPADMVFSGHKEMTPWPIQAFWPVTEKGWVLPLVSWGDLTATILFILAMFAIHRWPKKSQMIALFTLLAVHGYIGLCWLNGGIGRQ